MNYNAPITRVKSVTQQIEEIILARIQSGEYPPDQRMPSEDALSLEMGVSRASVRSALGNLTTAGYLRRRHGDGTYPNTNVFEIGIRSGKMWDIMRQIEASGRTAALRSLGQESGPATEADASLLRIPVGAPVLSMKRLFLADGKPVAVISNILRQSGLQESLPQDASTLSPFEALAQFCDSAPEECTIQFHAVLADAEISTLLSVPEHTPILQMTALLMDAKGEPMMAETEYYPGNEGLLLRAKLIL